MSNYYGPDYTGISAVIVVTILLVFGCTVGVKSTVSFKEKCEAAGGVPRFTKYDVPRCFTKEAIARDEIDVSKIELPTKPATNTEDLYAKRKKDSL